MSSARSETGNGQIAADGERRNKIERISVMQFLQQREPRRLHLARPEQQCQPFGKDQPTKQSHNDRQSATGPDVVADDHSYARSNAENCVDKYDGAIGNGRHDQSAATRQKSGDEQNNSQSNEARQIDSQAAQLLRLLLDVVAMINVTHLQPH